MTERDALKRALEALKGYRRELNDDQPCDAERDIEKLLAQPSGSVEQLGGLWIDGVAMKPSDMEAIAKTWMAAQPEQEPVIGTKTWFEDGKVVTQHLTAKDIYKDPEQPEQEPVAWYYEIDGSKAISFAKDGEPNKPWQGLYTQPQPKREPLTPHEIGKFVGTHEFGPKELKWFRLGEAAHGIKENT